MKKPAQKTRKSIVPAHRKWKVYWVRTATNDEFIAYGKPIAGGIELMETTIVTTFNDQMILAPYGTMAKDKKIVLKKEHVIHFNEVSDKMQSFYVASVSTSWDFVQKSFDAVIDLSKQTAIRAASHMEEPSAGAVSVTKKELVDEIDPRESAVDRLMKLAEAAGKGKNN